MELSQAPEELIDVQEKAALDEVQAMGTRPLGRSIPEPKSPAAHWLATCSATTVRSIARPNRSVGGRS